MAELDFAAVLALLKEIRDVGPWHYDRGYVRRAAEEAIALLKPHRDEWMEEFDRLLLGYADAVRRFARNPAVLIEANEWYAIHAHVQAERDRLEEMWKKK